MTEHRCPECGAVLEEIGKTHEDQPILMCPDGCAYNVSPEELEAARRRWAHILNSPDP